VSPALSGKVDSSVAIFLKAYDRSSVAQRVRPYLLKDHRD